MNYSSPSPVPYGQMPMSHHGPGTPISPQDGNPDMQNFARNVPAGMPVIYFLSLINLIKIPIHYFIILFKVS